MKNHWNGPPPDDPHERDDRLQMIISFWNGLSVYSDAGETTWGVLDELRTQVSDRLSRTPADIDVAMSLTALAALLISGQKLF